MRHFGVAGVTAFLSVCLSAGCTFYTACPSSGQSSGNSGSGGAESGGSTGLAGATNQLPGSWSVVTSNLASLPSECGNLSSLSAKPDEDLLIAGVALNGLWSSQDGGASWQPLGTGKGSMNISNRTSSIVYDPDNAHRFWESGTYDSLGAYVTSDDGDTFKALGELTHSDLISVDFTDSKRKTMVAGGHEMSQTLNKSTDGGATWSSIGDGLPADANCTTPLVIDRDTYLVGCSGYGGGMTGIYRTTDGGVTWASVTALGGASAPLRASDDSIYWANAVTGGGLIRSVDDGVTWSETLGAGVVGRSAPIEMPDGSIATLGGGAVIVSADHGVTWTAVSPLLPMDDARGVVYSAQQNAFFVWRFTCSFPAPIAVPADAIVKFALPAPAM